VYVLLSALYFGLEVPVEPVGFDPPVEPAGFDPPVEYVFLVLLGLGLDPPVEPFVLELPPLLELFTLAGF